MRRMPWFVLAVLVLGPIAVAAAAESEVVLRIRRADASSPAPFGLARRSLDAGPERPAGFEVPEGILDPVYARLEIAGKVRTVVVGKAPPEPSDEGGEEPAGDRRPAAADRLGFDADADGALREGEIHPFRPWARTVDREIVTGGTVRTLEIPAGDDTLALQVSLVKVGAGPVRITVVGHWFLEGDFEVDGRAYRLFFLDGDVDARFDGPDDLWLVLGAEETVLVPLHPLLLSGREEGRFREGRRFRLVGHAGGSARIAWDVAAGPRPEDLRLQRERVERLWLARLEPERAAFLERMDIDPARPRAAAPVPWRHVTFQEARERAEAEGKPLFVELAAFWCADSHRLTLHTYADEEVAALLRERFVVVRIWEEQDAAGDVRRLKRALGGRRLPVVGIWRPGSQKADVAMQGFQRPRDLVTVLRTVLGQAGDD
jgi:hypothetical protein